jgi:hypothetical protein
LAGAGLKKASGIIRAISIRAWGCMRITCWRLSSAQKYPFALDAPPRCWHLQCSSGDGSCHGSDDWETLRTVYCRCPRCCARRRNTSFAQENA